MKQGKSIALLTELLESKAEEYNRPAFIADDPVSIPHRFTLLQDREISGLFAATLAWGQRKTIVSKCRELLERMDNAPFDFIRNHSNSDSHQLEKFVHRTFNETDLLAFVRFLQQHYRTHASLESLFPVKPTDSDVEVGLIYFRNAFASARGCPARTLKHVATPEKASACKRLNMFLRWMVRCDTRGVDFGVWKSIRASQLICPMDVHVSRVARALRLIPSGTVNWKMAVKLTDRLRAFDPTDPVRYDFALFGIGLEGRSNAQLRRVLDGR